MTLAKQKYMIKKNKVIRNSPKQVDLFKGVFMQSRRKLVGSKFIMCRSRDEFSNSKYIHAFFLQ